MAHDVEQRVATSGEFGARLARAANTVSQHYAVILWMTVALTIVYLVLLPPCEDVIVGLAWADLEALQGHFPMSLSDLWLSRGIGYKTFLYLAEGLSRFIADDAPRARTEVFNAIFIALALGVLYGAYRALLLRCDPVEMKRFSLRDRAETLALAALCFVPAVIWSWEQDTHISVLLCVLGIGLALSPSVRAQWGSGVVLILLFSIKGVTAIDFLFVIATALATGEAARIRRVVISAAAAIVATALAYATILRAELDNILLGAQFQQPAHLGRFIRNGFQFAVYDPVIPIALVALAAAVGAGLTRKRLRLVGFAIFIWLVPLAGLFAQHEFFGYHYQGFVLSSWLCLMALYLAQGGHWADFLAIRWAPALTKIFVIVACCVDLAAIGISLLTPRQTIYSRPVVEHRLDCWIQITKQTRSAILANDPGLAESGAVVNLTRFSYGLGLRSALRFFFPLPLQNQNLGTQASKDYVRSIVEYDGPAVIAYAGMMKLGDTGLAPILAHLRADYRPLLVLAPLCEDVRNSGVAVWMRAKN
jgi:hypothetical protein